MRLAVVVPRTAVLCSLLLASSGCGEAASQELPPTEVASVQNGILIDHSLAVTDEFILEPFTLERVLTQIVNTAGASGNTNALRLFHQWWDTQNFGPGIGPGPNCDDAFTPFGQFGHNDFPWECQRDEGYQIGVDPFAGSPRDHLYMPIGLFNRFDLAPANGAHCGEYRIVYAMRPGHPDSRGRNFLIFEAVLPNPDPSSGIRGCYDVASFWADLSNMPNPSDRRRMLERFYFRGITNFPPVVHVDHYGTRLGGDGYGCSTGQIRTNQFVGRPWNLREFRLVKDCRCADDCHLLVVPTTVKDNPHGPLYDTSSPEPLSSNLQQHVVNSVFSLGNGGVEQFGWTVPNEYNSGESLSEFGFNTDYPMFFNNGIPFDPSFDNNLGNMLGMMPAPINNLSPEHIVRRSLALSCAGCHELSNNDDLGNGVIWPPSLGFVHVEEFAVNGRFPMSVALERYFLPNRQRILEYYLETGGEDNGADFKCEIPLPKELHVDCRGEAGRDITLRSFDSKSLEKLKPRIEGGLLGPSRVH